MTKNQSIRWMVEAKVFHEILQWCEGVKLKQPEWESLSGRQAYQSRGATIEHHALT